MDCPSFSDKLLQEVIRSLLEAYYEPQFSEASHGFRPQRGCHTALSQIVYTWKGTHWFIEGDIKACFEQLDHQILLKILAEKIHDNRFLRLIKYLLQAGYLEEWRYHTTLSGAPQGGIVSPILSNIYLDQLDHFIETTLIPQYTQGLKRKENPAYSRVKYQIAVARKKGQHRQAHQLLRKAQQLPSRDPNDPSYRRLRYIRYADDMLLGFAGTRAEAVQIKHQLATYLRETLHLELSEEKTLITHARSQAARFLSYDIRGPTRQRETCLRWLSTCQRTDGVTSPKRRGEKEGRFVSTRGKTVATALTGLLLRLYHLEDLSRRISGLRPVLFARCQCLLAQRIQMDRPPIPDPHLGGQISQHDPSDGQTLPSHRSNPSWKENMPPSYLATRSWEETAGCTVRRHPSRTKQRGRPG